MEKGEESGVTLPSAGLVILACVPILLAQSPAEKPSERPLHLQEVPVRRGADGELVAPGKTTVYWPQGEKRAGAELGLQIDRVWSEGRKTFASVTVRNTSPRVLAEIVVRCAALGPNEKELSFQERRFSSAEQGPIQPGFATNLKLTLDIAGSAIRSASCNARGF
jgi:hypothetical protein